MATVVRVVSQWPVKEAQIEIKKGQNVGDVKKAAAAALGLTEEGYQWAQVEFGKDVIHWNNKKDADPQDLAELSMLYALAPPTVLPKRTLKKEEASAGGDDVDEKFKGITKDNIWKKIAKGNPPKVLLEYFDVYAESLLEHKMFVKLPRPVIIGLLSRDTLAVPEAKVLEAVMAWGKHALKRSKQADTPENLKQILDGVIKVVRFTTMATEDIASKVAPIGILDQDQILELFTFIAARDSGMPPGKSLAKFTHKEREGAGNSWNPADCGDPRIEFRDKNMTLAGPAQYLNLNMGVRAKSGYTTGKHFWTITVQLYNGGGNGYNTAGVCLKSCPLRADHGYPFAGTSDQAWVVEMCRLQRLRGTSHSTESYGSSGGRQVKNNDIIGFLLNCDDGTLTIYYNGVSLGQSHTGLKGKGPLYPCMGIGRLHQNIYVTNFSAKIPS
jgi:hypothetical protein